MSNLSDSEKPFGNLFSELSGKPDMGRVATAAHGEPVGHRALPDPRDSLQKAAQLAIQVEFTTIPAYLTALYSIADPASDAYQALRSVVVEEMFHLNQAANLLVAIGGKPKFTGTAVPVYPCFLPHSNPKRLPLIALCRASPDVFEKTFAAIETPAPPHAAPQGNQYDTIAQLYEALRESLERYPERHPDGPPLFRQAAGTRQRIDIYLGKFGGKAVRVHDIGTALEGITQIMQQGEGSVPEDKPLVPDSPWGTYNHYGQRTDGTYGPILGTPYEMSHFRKFRGVALDVANFPATRPITSNPRRQDYSNETALKLADAFDIAYSIMLDELEKTFIETPGKPDPFFAKVLPLMHHVMPKLALSLMKTPMHATGDGAVGPNAAPTWLYRPGCTMEMLERERANAQQAASGVTDRAERADLAAVLDDVRNDIVELSEAAGQRLAS
ncbi:ferritin-like domain-containing protein [Burkholderia sp. PU8-34]